MLTRHPLTTLLVSVLAVACIPDPIAPTSGLYDVEVDVLSDSCNPGYEVTSYETHLRVDADGLQFGILHNLAGDPETVEDAFFGRADGDRLEYVSDPETTKIGCMTVTRTTTVTLGHEEYVSVIDEEEWVRAEDCTDPVAPAGSIPTTTCSAERSLSMYLRMACDETCTVAMDPLPRCDCP